MCINVAIFIVGYWFTVMGLVREILLTFLTINSFGLRIAATISFLAELLITFFVIRKVPFTEIDWSTYMQQVGCYLKGERNYTRIEGDTGPIVYPAGHLRVYSLFYRWTNGGKDLELAQYIFAALYLINVLLVFRLYLRSRKIPPFVLLLVTFTSYRVHSIFLLRLFNDPIAMLLFYVSLNLFINHNWWMGIIFYSLAVSIKMNVLLFAPAVFAIIFINTGARETISLLLTAGIIQICVALEFIIYDPLAYITRAFQFNRVFMYKWTVNWRFLPETVFLDKRFHSTLSIVHIFVLAFFARTLWYRSQGGLTNLMTKGIRTRIDIHGILYSLFTANLIGIVFARSLHYQFYCWYYHSLPYLLFATLYPVTARTDANSSQPIQSIIPFRSIFLRILILIGIEYCWNVYPSTVFSSLLLHFLHFFVLYLIV